MHNFMQIVSTVEGQRFHASGGVWGLFVSPIRGALGSLAALSTACVAVASNSHRFCLTVHLVHLSLPAWTLLRCQHHEE